MSTKAKKKATPHSRKEAARKARETRLLRSIKVPGLAIVGGQQVVESVEKPEESSDSE